MTLDEMFAAGVEFQRAGKLAEAENVYRQVLAGRPNHSNTSINLGTLLHGVGRYAEAVRVYRMAIALDASRPELWSNLGFTLFELGEIEDSAVVCREALAINPQLSSAHNNLGNALKSKGKLDEAAEHYRRSIALSPDFAIAHNNLGTILHVRGELEAAIAEFRRAIERMPNYAEAFSNMATSLGDLRRHGEAREAFGRALAARPDYATAHFNLGLLLLKLGEMDRGWKEYEWRWSVRGLIKERFEFARPMWNGEELGGRRILLHAEQGYGDAIQFGRYAAKVSGRGGRVTLLVPDELVRLMSGLGGVERVAGFGQTLPEFDLHCPLLSLPLVFKTNLTDVPADVPYLWSDPALAARWRERITDHGGRKVGLAWAGRAVHSNDRQRSIALAALAPLANASSMRPNGVRFFSLQKGEAAAQAKAPPFAMTDWTDELHDFADTAALIENLDLLITVDTAVAHLAGAMGRPVWMLVPYAPDFRWMADRSDSPWYPTLRLFRQERFGDWTMPIAQIVEELATI